MNLTRLRLENFKRFTDLTIDLSSFVGAPKLVLLIGANGSGKSSVFDAFEYLSAPHKGDPAPPSTRFSDAFSDAFYKGEAYDKFLRYLKKDPATAVSASCSFGGGFEVGRSEGSAPIASPDGWDVKSAFYGRSSLRTVPELRARAHPGGRRALDSGLLAALDGQPLARLHRVRRRRRGRRDHRPRRPRLRPPAGADAGAEVRGDLRDRGAQGFRAEGLSEPDAGRLREPGRVALQRDRASRPAVRRREGQERRRSPARTGSSRSAWTLGRVLVVVFAWRGSIARIISSRKATARERRQYEAES